MKFFRWFYVWLIRISLTAIFFYLALAFLMYKEPVKRNTVFPETLKTTPMKR